jgi:hypothetical protein
MLLQFRDVSHRGGIAGLRIKPDDDFEVMLNGKMMNQS